MHAACIPRAQLACIPGSAPAGLSLRTQELTAAFLAVRLFCSFMMEYDIHTLLDLLTLLATGWVIFSLRGPLRESYQVPHGCVGPATCPPGRAEAGTPGCSTAADVSSARVEPPRFSPKRPRGADATTAMDRAWQAARITCCVGGQDVVTSACAPSSPGRPTWM